MKSIFQSKTFWFNVLTILIGVATFFGFVPNQALMNLISGALLAIAPLINIVLRFITDKGVYL